MAIQQPLTLAIGGRVRFIRDLLAGDPMAWAIAGVLAVVLVGGVAIKAHRNRSSLDK